MTTQTVLCGDSLQIMKTFRDKQFSLCLTDPPYGLGYGGEKDIVSPIARKDGSLRIGKTWSNPVDKKYDEWDDTKPTKEFFDEVFRVSKHQIIWGGNYFTDYLPPSNGWLIWDKKTTMPSLSKCELAWTSFLGHTEIKHYLWAGYAKEVPEQRYHSTQKPLEVMKWCLSLFPEAQTILDPFAGSFTTGVACKQLNRDFVGIEISAKYCEIGRKRLDATTQPMIFSTDAQQGQYLSKGQSVGEGEHTEQDIFHSGTPSLEQGQKRPASISEE